MLDVPLTDTEKIALLQESYEEVIQMVNLEQSIHPIKLNRAGRLDHFKFKGVIVGSGSEVAFKHIKSQLKCGIVNSYTDEYTRDTVEVGKIGDTDYGFTDFDQVNNEHKSVPQLFNNGVDIISTTFDNTFFLMTGYVYPHPILIREDTEPLVIPPVITSFNINNGDIFTESSSVVTRNVCTGDPTHYKISIYEDLSDADWVAYATTVNFEMYQIGVNRLYFITKNGDGDSEVAYSEIGWAGTEDHEFEDDVPILTQEVTDGIVLSNTQHPPEGNNDTHLYLENVPALTQTVTDSIVIEKPIGTPI